MLKLLTPICEQWVDESVALCTPFRKSSGWSVRPRFWGMDPRWRGAALAGPCGWPDATTHLSVDHL